MCCPVCYLIYGQGGGGGRSGREISIDADCASRSQTCVLCRAELNEDGPLLFFSIPPPFPPFFFLRLRLNGRPKYIYRNVINFFPPFLGFWKIFLLPGRFINGLINEAELWAAVGITWGTLLWMRRATRPSTPEDCQAETFHSAARSSDATHTSIVRSPFSLGRCQVQWPMDRSSWGEEGQSMLCPWRVWRESIYVRLFQKKKKKKVK